MGLPLRVIKGARVRPHYKLVAEAQDSKHVEDYIRTVAPNISRKAIRDRLRRDKVRIHTNRRYNSNDLHYAKKTAKRELENQRSKFLELRDKLKESKGAVEDNKIKIQMIEVILKIAQNRHVLGQNLRSYANIKGAFDMLEEVQAKRKYNKVRIETYKNAKIEDIFESDKSIFPNKKLDERDLNLFEMDNLYYQIGRNLELIGHSDLATVAYEKIQKPWFKTQMDNYSR